MPDFEFNIAHGRTVELYRRVKVGDPADSALTMVVLATGVASDATLKDLDTLADVLSTSPEVTNSGYSRKYLLPADLNTVTPDDVNDRTDLDIPDVTFTSVQAGTGWAKILICYQPSSGSADSAVVPLTAHDFPLTPDGSNIIVQVDPAGFFRAQ